MNQKGFSPIIVAILTALLLVTALIAFSALNQNKSLPLPQLSQLTSPTEKRKFVALGASFTKANNLSSQLVGDHPDYSFATGTKIKSFYLYLQDTGENLDPVNLAESGATSQKVLDHQLPNALAYHPQFVTLDIVADIFEATTPTNLQQNLTQIISALKADGATILLSTYPNLSQMRTASFPACHQDILHLGVDKITTQKLTAFNQAIKQVATEQSIILVDNYQTLGPNDVSDYDCLHPNIKGQEKLAQKWIDALKKGGD